MPIEIIQGQIVRGGWKNSQKTGHQEHEVPEEHATYPDFASQDGLQARMVRCAVCSELRFSQGSVKGADFNWSGALYLGAVFACCMGFTG